MQSGLPMLQCALRYTCAYVLFVVFFGVIQVWFDLSLGVVATAVTLAVSTGYVARWVVLRRGLPLTVMQALQLALCSLFMAVLVALLIIGAALLQEQLRGYLALLDRSALNYVAMLMAAYLAVVLLLQWALYYFFARLYYRGLQKRGRVDISSEMGEQ